MDLIQLNKINLQVLNCSHCGHKWIPRIIPVQCPRCKTYNWNKKIDYDQRKAEWRSEKFKLMNKKTIRKLLEQVK
jgi:hypothetical protein